MGAASADAGDFASAEATKGLCDRPLETFARSPRELYGGRRWQGAAALSAAVTITNQQETAPTSHGRTSQKKNQAYSQLLFGRGGLGERRFS